MMQDRKALQAGTSHDLGQNFAKAFDVTYQNGEGNLEHVWATSWGVSTRLIGAHYNDAFRRQGACDPPKLAPIEAVIVPIFRNSNKNEVLAYADGVYRNLSKRFTDGNRPGRATTRPDGNSPNGN